MASQSDIAGYDVPHFTGESAEEAQDFIQAVNKRAYAAEKHKDNAWIADFAYPFFSRNALVWYEDLDEVTQNDWKLLKRAILAEFTRRQPAPSTVPSAAPAVISSLSPYAAAAPPPPALTRMVGRIRVDSEEPKCRGYLGVQRSENIFGILCENVNQASIFEGEEEKLVIKAYSKSYTLSAGTSNFGVVSRSSEDLGTQWANTWSLSGGGNVVKSSLQADGRECDAKFASYALRGSICIPADMHKFLEEHRAYRLATLQFEPMS